LVSVIIVSSGWAETAARVEVDLTRPGRPGDTGERHVLAGQRVVLALTFPVTAGGVAGARGDLFQRSATTAVPLRRDFELVAPRVPGKEPLEGAWEVPAAEREIRLLLTVRPSRGETRTVPFRVHPGPVLGRLAILGRPMLALSGKAPWNALEAEWEAAGLTWRRGDVPEDEAVCFRRVEGNPGPVPGKRMVSFLEEPSGAGAPVVFVSTDGWEIWLDAAELDALGSDPGWQFRLTELVLTAEERFRNR
jgi:hypothetical protein